MIESVFILFIFKHY